MRVAVSICVVLIVSLIVAGVVTVITKRWEIAIFATVISTSITMAIDNKLHRQRKQAEASHDNPNPP